MRRKYKQIFLFTKNIDRSGYVWNAAAGIVFAMQSAVMLIVITRTNGIDDAGVFSIAYAIAGMMSFIGEFGVRKYQASDVKEENSFADYYTFRLASCSAMILACLVYALFGVAFRNYSFTKFMVIMMVSLVKLVEAFVDVFYGRFQQKGRLDVAAKTNSFRIVFGMLCCMISLKITHNLFISCIVWVIAVVVGMFLSTLSVASEFCKTSVTFRLHNFKKILLECTPLFLGCFLLLYIGNAPKYAIDSCMNDASQAYFNFIFMPVFVISMLANFIFNPVLVEMSEKWNEKKLEIFKKMVLKQIIFIACLTILAIIVAMTIGCPVLGWLYNANLSEFRAELCILMVGGGALALINFFTIVVTVIRRQNRLSAGYIFGAVLAFLLSSKLVRAEGIMGASIIYTALTTILGIFFAIVMIISIRQDAAAWE